MHVYGAVITTIENHLKVLYGSQFIFSIKYFFSYTEEI